MPVVLKPAVPEPAYPPPERLIFDATPLQAHLIRQHVESGYGAGVNRLHSRLSKQFAGMIHPGMDTTRPADDPENFQRDPATGQAVLEETHVYDANCQYVAGAIRALHSALLVSRSFSRWPIACTASESGQKTLAAEFGGFWSSLALNDAGNHSAAHGRPFLWRPLVMARRALAGGRRKSPVTTKR